MTPFASRTSLSSVAVDAWIAGVLDAVAKGKTPDRWGQRLIHRAFRNAGEQRALSEIDYLLAINDRTRIGALRYRREGEERVPGCQST